MEAAQATGVAWAYDELIRAIGNWSAEVFAYFDHRVTNAATESLNNLTRLANRMGRGYSFKAIRAKMLYATRNRRAKPVKKEVDSMHESVDKYIVTEPLVSEGVDIDTLVLVLQYKTNSKTPEQAQAQVDAYSTFHQSVGRVGKRRVSTHDSE